MKPETISDYDILEEACHRSCLNGRFYQVEKQIKDLADSVSENSEQIKSLVVVWESSIKITKEWMPKFFWLLVGLISVSIGKNLWELFRP